MQELIDKARKEAAVVFVWVLFALYIGNAIMVALITPLTHIGTLALMPQHLWLAMFWSALAVIGPVVWLLRNPASTIARHLAAVIIGLECSLATALSGGQIELHFAYFIAMVFLGMALDVKILWTFTLMVLIDHAVRGWIFPDSVYGCSMWKDGRPPLWLALEHAGFVAVQLLGLLLFIRQRIRGLGELAGVSSKLSQVEQAKIDAIMSGLNTDLLARIAKLERKLKLRSLAAMEKGAL